MGRKKLGLSHEALNASTPEAEYWRGFIAAVANTSYNPGKEPRITIETSAEDYNHLVTLREFLQSKHSITLYRNSARLSLMSQPLAIILYEKGIYKKPHMLKKPLIDNSQTFWRGVIDGGACIGFYQGYARIQLVAEEQLAAGFQKYIKGELQLEANLRAVGKRRCVAWTGSSALTVIKHIYESPGTCNLRKYHDIKEVIHPHVRRYVLDRTPN